MKRTLVTAMGFMTVLILSACQSEPQSPLSTDGGGLELSRGPLVQSAVGSGSFVVAGPGDWRTFAFEALRFADASVKGQWERIRRQDGNAADSKSHGIVLCFRIIGNEAYIGGRAESGLFSDPPNNETGWRVVDNGEGNGFPPDQMSLEFVGAEPGFANDYCAGNVFFGSPPLNNIEAGNIQVNP